MSQLSYGLYHQLRFAAASGPHLCELFSICMSQRLTFTQNIVRGFHHVELSIKTMNNDIYNVLTTITNANSQEANLWRVPEQSSVLSALSSKCHRIPDGLTSAYRSRTTARRSQTSVPVRSCHGCLRQQTPTRSHLAPVLGPRSRARRGLPRALPLLTDTSADTADRCTMVPRPFVARHNSILRP